MQGEVLRDLPLLPSRAECRLGGDDEANENM
jgi:hypothetical protein